MSSVSLRNVTKRFMSGGLTRHVLVDISLEINSGEMVCLFGPSGCGKSTLLSLVAGLEAADSGQVYVDADKVSGPRDDVAVVFQDGALFPWLNVRQNVEFGLLNRDSSRSSRRTKVDEVLNRVGLLSHQTKRAHELSGGLRQRVALARSLVLQPKVLLLDEPFAALDDPTRFGLHTELQALWVEYKPTVLFVTHNIREGVVIGDRVVCMSASPSSVALITEVRFPRPRSVEDIEVSELAVAISNRRGGPS